jgi:hypothetical protein
VSQLAGDCVEIDGRAFLQKLLDFRKNFERDYKRPMTDQEERELEVAIKNARKLFNLDDTAGQG